MFNALRGRDPYIDDANEIDHRSFRDHLSHLDAVIPVHAHDGEHGRFIRLTGRAVVIFVLGFLAYLPCLWASLTPDEVQQLKYVNPPLPNFHSARSIVGWFEPGVRGTPPLLQWLVFCEAKPGSPGFIFHFTSVGLHCLSAVMLWFVLRRLAVPAAWAAAAVFAVHPANVSAVGWVNEQARIWACLFSLIGLLLLLKNRQIPASEVIVEPDDLTELPAVWGPRLRLAATLCFAAIAFLAAALCQPTAAIVPVIAVLVVIWRKKLGVVDWIIVAVFGVAGATLAVHAILGRTPNSPVKTEHFSTLGRLVWPVGRMLADTLLIHGPLIPWNESGHVQINLAIGLGAILIVGLIISIALFRQLGAGPALLAMTFVLLLPTASTPTALHRPENPIIFGDPYLCTIPVAIAVVFAVNALVRRMARDHLRLILASAMSLMILLCAAAITSTRALAMSDTLTLFKAAVASNATSLPAKSRLAEYYLDDPQLSSTDRIKLASAQLPAISPEECTSATSAITYGDLQEVAGDLALAQQWYEKAESLDPQNVDAPMRLGAVLVQQNKRDAATDSYKSAIARQPTNLALRNEFALMLDGLGKPDLAIEQYNAAIRINPDYVPAHVNLANTLIRLQRYDDAARELQAVLAIDPENFEVFHNAGVVEAQLRHYLNAVNFLTAAVQLRPDSAEAHNDLGVALVGAGKFDRAVFEFQQAIGHNPNYDAAKHNLVIAQRHRDEARASKYAIQPASSQPN